MCHHGKSIKLLKFTYIYLFLLIYQSEMYVCRNNRSYTSKTAPLISQASNKRVGCIPTAIYRVLQPVFIFIELV